MNNDCCYSYGILKTLNQLNSLLLPLEEDETCSPQKLKFFHVENKLTMRGIDCAYSGGVLKTFNQLNSLLLPKE